MGICTPACDLRMADSIIQQQGLLAPCMQCHGEAVTRVYLEAASGLQGAES